MRGTIASFRFPRTRQWVRSTFDTFKFDRAMRRFIADPQAAVQLESTLLRDLIGGWGNSNWSALDEFLRIGIDHVLKTEGPILECGTGLSTLLFGVIAQQRGVEYWALEHLPEWSDKISQRLAHYNIRTVRVSTAPLRRYDGFDWYDPPMHEMPRRFSLVVCDGPPSQTRGGRYGLGPMMQRHLKAGCVVLLDDAEREHERAIASRWQSELGAEAEFVEGRKPLIRLCITGHADEDEGRGRA
jgi:hypothetical protein